MLIFNALLESVLISLPIKNDQMGRDPRLWCTQLPRSQESSQIYSSMQHKLPTSSSSSRSIFNSSASALPHMAAKRCSTHCICNRRILGSGLFTGSSVIIVNISPDFRPTAAKEVLLPHLNRVLVPVQTFSVFQKGSERAFRFSERGYACATSILPPCL